MTVRGIGSTVLCISLAVGVTACRNRDGNPMIGRAEASVPHNSHAAERAAELAAARALIGDEDDGGGSSGTSTRANGQGTARWRDTVVYVDGRPTGVLRFGELPIALKPVWVDEKVSAEVEPGTHGPGYKIRQVRRYRFVNLLTALGVDLKKVRELHVQGPKLSQVLIVSGAELRSHKAKDLLFRFGSLTGGKALPVIPADFGNRQHFDKISSVMVYVDKKPPTLVANEGLELDGKELDGVAYYGEPMRGGMRIYSDDKLAAQIKKPLLDELTPVSRDGGLARYKLSAVLALAGVDTSKTVEGWVIANERRTRKLSRDELMQLTVAMGDRHKNEMMVGSEKLEGESIALHSRNLAAADMPQIRPDEE
ncbi:MAG TPA: hypothetical protein VHB97_01725 [Polyangia bacterium]|jgi:hypothetical protein|nr:hypothetical protein [Polyangia bacterium]